MTKWTTVASGIRCRDHPERRHGVRPDRYFTLRFMSDGRRREEALGWASDGWTLKRAQEELGKLREANRTGRGEATLRERRAKAERSRIRSEKDVASLWDRYAKEVMALHNKPRTINEKTRMWKGRIEPAIGHLRIGDITQEDVDAIVRGPLRADGKGRVTGGKAEAGNLYRLLHHLFRTALRWKLRSQELGNPLEEINEPKVARRERLLTGAEVGALLKALDRMAEEGKEPPAVIAVIRAAILTGARIGELLALEWSHVRRDEMELHLPDTKSGFSRRPLSVETLALLDSVDIMPGVPYIFRAVENPRAPLTYSTVEKAFRRIATAAGVKNCSLHTIRHWFATMTANSVSNPRVGMSLTGHKSHATYLRYVHSDREQARALADQLAKFASELGKAPPNVTDMTKKRA
jgi:integrase